MTVSHILANQIFTMHDTVEPIFNEKKESKIWKGLGEILHIIINTWSYQPKK